MSTQIVLYASNPYHLYDKNALYVVERGEVNIFAVSKEGGKKFLTTFQEGELFFSLKSFKNDSFYITADAGSIEPIIKEVDKEQTSNQSVARALTRFSKFTGIKEFTTLENTEFYEALNGYFKDFEKELNDYFAKMRETDLASLNNKIQNDSKLTKQAILRLGSVLNPAFDDESFVNETDDILVATIGNICRYLEIETGAVNKVAIDEKDPVTSIAKLLHVRVRQVSLKKGWHKQDNGVVLGFTKELVPVALLPKGTKGYFVLNLQDNTKEEADDERAASLLNEGYMFYRPLAAKKLGLMDIVKYVSVSNRKDIFAVFIISMLVGLIALITPLVMRKLFDEIIPDANRIQTYEVFYVLLIAGFSTALFQLVKGLTSARLKSKMALDLEAAVWDRLINLPAKFFRKYSTGDLALRADGINHIQDILSGTVIASLLSGVFSVFSFLLLFKFSLKLALIGLALVAFAIVVNVSFMLIQLRYQRKIIKASADITSYLLEVVSGMQKLKIANAVDRAYAKWAQQYALQSKLVYKAGFWQNFLKVFNGVFRLFVSITIYITIAFFLKEQKDFSTGEFIAFSNAFSQFLVASLSMSSSLLSILNVKPIYERIKPILEEIPEVEASKRDPGELDGNIELHNLSFNYEQGGSKILDGIDFSINSGEFVAIVGPSGGGKSTLLRLLLGFEKPSKGNIFYSDQNLQDIDVRAIRSQLGVVLQNGRVIAGDIYTNIVGATNKTVDEAWEAARMAGLDADIEQMPMGMHTIVSDGGGTFSGGQQQRLLIARALINKPKIIFFDEATSSLDNKTQAIVSKSLEALDATRVVIAHRLSTIVHADKILVLEKGKIIQSGTYEQLMNEEGLFKELAKRQLM